MFEIHKVSFLDSPDLQPYRTMRWQAEHRELGIFVAEGDKVVRRLLESSFPVISLLIQERWLEEYRVLLEKRAELIRVYIIEKEALEELTGYPHFQGALALGKIPTRITLKQVLETAEKPYFFTAVDGVNNAMNMGNLVRNALAFNIQALITSGNSCSPYLRRAVRNAMGAIFHLPIVESPDLLESLISLKNHGIRCIAAHPHTKQTILPHSDFSQSCCIIFGNEGTGISPEVLSLCDSLVAVPMNPFVDSLNVGSASAVFMYEAARQRQFSPHQIYPKA